MMASQPIDDARAPSWPCAIVSTGQTKEALSATVHQFLRQAGMLGQTARPTEAKRGLHLWKAPVEVKMMKPSHPGHDIL